MSIACNGEKELKQWSKDADALLARWDNNPAIRKRYTKRVGNGEEFMGDEALSGLHEWMREKMNMPFNENLPFTKEQINLAERWIDHFGKNLEGRFTNLAYIVPEGLSKQDPSSRKLHLRMNDILNEERVKINTLGTGNALISLNLIEAYIDDYGKKVGKKKLKDIRDVRQRMINADSEESYNEWSNKFGKIMGENEGKIIRHFEELLEFTPKEFEKIGEKDFKVLNERTGKEEDRTYNPNTVRAAKEARGLLKDIGMTYVNGLTKIAGMIVEKYRYGNPARGKELSQRVLSLQKDLEIDIQKGGYYPHILFDQLIDIKRQLSESFDPKNGNSVDWERTVSSLTDKINESVQANADPNNVRKRNPLLQRSYEKDPILAITTYANEAIQFNKLAHTQEVYLKTLRDIPNHDSLFTEGLSRFIQEQYAVFTRGTTGRSAFANNAVTVLNSIQTAATMGLNITGAIKNAASIMHFYTRIGHKSTKDAVQAYNHNQKLGVSGEEQFGFADFVRKAEKEAGFLFTDAAGELYAEGTASLKSMMGEGTHDFDPLTGKVTFNGTPVKDLLLKAGQWTVEKGLFFHRHTENAQRRWMYRTALYHQYNKLSKMGLKSGGSKGAQAEAKKWALQMVNSWAYEYSAHAKSKMVRGEWRTIEEMDDGQVISRRMKKTGGKQALSEIAFHLLHYPMSLAETQYDQLSKAHKAYLAGQGFQSEEIQWAARQAGVMSLITLGSVVFNSDLSNIFENETLNRLQNVAKDITEYDNKDKSTFGLLGEFTGPTIGALKRALIAHGLIDVDESTLNKILFGNVNFADVHDEKAQRLDKYKWGTFAGTTVNKILPSLQAGRGRDLITHYLKLYPNDFTKKYNALLFNRKPATKKASTKGMSPDLKASLALLKGISS